MLLKTIIISKRQKLEILRLAGRIREYPAHPLQDLTATLQVQIRERVFLRVFATVTVCTAIQSFFDTRFLRTFGF